MSLLPRFNAPAVEYPRLRFLSNSHHVCTSLAVNEVICHTDDLSWVPRGYVGSGRFRLDRKICKMIYRERSSGSDKEGTGEGKAYPGQISQVQRNVFFLRLSYTSFPMHLISPVANLFSSPPSLGLSIVISVKNSLGHSQWLNVYQTGSFCASSAPSPSGDMFDIPCIDSQDPLLPPGVTSCTRTGF